MYDRKSRIVIPEQERIPLIERIPQVEKFCLCAPLGTGSMIIGISGIVLGCFSFLAFLLLRGKSTLSFSAVLLLLVLSVFTVVTIVFIIGSALLIVAVVNERPDYIPAYIWIAIIYWMTQLLLGIFMPLILLSEGGSSFFTSLVWSCLVVTLALTWTHYLAVVKSYLLYLYSKKNRRTCS